MSSNETWVSIAVGGFPLSSRVAADYGTIAHGLQFRRGRKVSSHQNVLFCGDLNYRMAMPNEHVRDLATSDRFPELIEADQVCCCASATVRG